MLGNFHVSIFYTISKFCQLFRQFFLIYYMQFIPSDITLASTLGLNQFKLDILHPLQGIRHIWSKVMRMYIGLIICHFLVSAVSITKSQKNKIMGKTDFYGLSACQGSAVEWFLFYRVSRKIAKNAIFGAPYSNLYNPNLKLFL